MRLWWQRRGFDEESEKGEWVTDNMWLGGGVMVGTRTLMHVCIAQSQDLCCQIAYMSVTTLRASNGEYNIDDFTADCHV